MKTFLVRGVPSGLKQDSWWLDGDIAISNHDTPDPGISDLSIPQSLMPLGVCLAVVLLAAIVCPYPHNETSLTNGGSGCDLSFVTLPEQPAVFVAES